jgi:hypothetical protein
MSVYPIFLTNDLCSWGKNLKEEVEIFEKSKFSCKVESDLLIKEFNLKSKSKLSG